MAWIADGGCTFVNQGARVAYSERGTGIFHVLGRVAMMRTIYLRPTVEQLRSASTFIKLWDEKLPPGFFCVERVGKAFLLNAIF